MTRARVNADNALADVLGVTAGTGLSGGGTSGTVTVAIDTATTVDKTTAQTLTNKTLTSPALTTPTISTATTNGDLLYGTGSGALTRLGIGSSAQVLTVAGGVPTWATPAGATTSYSLITSASNPSGTNVATLSGLSGYNSLVLYYENILINATNGNLRIQFNSDTGSNYQYWYYASFGSSNTNSDTLTGTSFNSMYTSLANNAMHGYMKIEGANGTGKKLIQYPNFSYNYTSMNNAVYNSTSVISSINLTSVGGNFNGGAGSFKVYGSVV